MVMPSRSAAIQSKFGIFAPDVVPFCVKMMSALAPRLGEIRQRAIGPRHIERRVDLQLLGVGDPFLAEAFPGEHIDRARRPASTTSPSPPRPYRKPARWRSCSRPGTSQQRARAVDRFLQLGLARLGAVRTAERRAFQRRQTPARTFLGGARGKPGIGRAQCRLRGYAHQLVSHPHRWTSAVGSGWPRPQMPGFATERNGANAAPA